MDRIKVKSPATIANLVCGFDILGMSIREPFDEIELILKNEPGIAISHKDNFGLPTDPQKNIVGVALQAMIDSLQIKKGFEVVITKNIKPGSGIGSSAASAAGIIAAANMLLGADLSLNDQIKYAMEGEMLASGSRHADNLAPSIYGGITLIRDTSSLDIIRLDAPLMHVTIVHPQIEVKTSYAREILPKDVSLKDAIRQWANVAGLISGFLKKDYDLIGRSLEDFIIEPVRSKLIPGYDEVMKKCKAVGVIGGGISGSGPSLFMLSKDEATAKKAELIMKEIYIRLNIPFITYVTTVNDKGVEKI